MVYSEKGFAAATSTIAKQAGVAHGSVFLHFPTTDDLLSSLLNEFGNSVVMKLNKLAEAKGSIEELLDAHIEVLIEYEQFYSRIVNEKVLLPEAAQTILKNIQSALSLHFNKVFEQGIEDKVIRKLPVHILFYTWIGLVHYYLQNKEQFVPEGPVLKRYKKQLIFTYCELIRKL